MQVWWNVGYLSSQAGHLQGQTGHAVSLHPRSQGMTVQGIGNKEDDLDKKNHKEWPGESKQHVDALL
jgi:hypothetical protein